VKVPGPDSVDTGIAAAMTRLVVAIVALAFLSAAAFVAFLRDGVAEAAPATRITLGVGDEVRVQGSTIGCRVTRLAGHGRRLYVECRRAGPLAGTYGTYFGRDDVLVVRFVDRRTARTVLEAQHQARAKRCQSEAGA
jgi:hypothetical protein